MGRKGFLAAVLLVLCVVSAETAEPTVSVGSTRYPTALTSQIAGKPVKMVLTGTALRTKLGMSVYTIGSYVQENARVSGPHDLAAAAVPKQLCLAFEREVGGDKLAQSFRDSIGMVSPAPAFAAELATLTRYMKAHPVKKGTCIWLTSIPGMGLRCRVIGGPEVAIDNAAFARAVWEVYLGRKNLGVAIQTGLTSRL
jgi:hypothetical protein